MLKVVNFKRNVCYNNYQYEEVFRGSLIFVVLLYDIVRDKTNNVDTPKISPLVDWLILGSIILITACMGMLAIACNRLTEVESFKATTACRIQLYISNDILMSILVDS